MLFLPIKFKTIVNLSPAELDSKYNERIVNKIKEEYEGVCSKYGYIKSGSIKVLKRSCGNMNKTFFNGITNFELVCKAEVCNPVKGGIISAVVKNKNQLGILAESYIESDSNSIPILDVIIPIRSAGIISEIDLDLIQVGDSINVEVMGKKYQDKDRKISVIGRVVDTNIEIENEIVEDVIGDEEIDNATLPVPDEYDEAFEGEDSEEEDENEEDEEDEEEKEEDEDEDEVEFDEDDIDEEDFEEEFDEEDDF